MADSENLADLFAELWCLFDADPVATKLAAETLDRVRDQANTKIMLRSRIRNDGHKALEYLRKWIRSNGPGQCSELQRALLVAGAIDGWYTRRPAEPAFRDGPNPNDQAYALANRVAWINLFGKHRFNFREDLGQVIPRRPFGGRHHNRDYPPPEVNGVADLFDTLFLLPKGIAATHPDDSCSTFSESDPSKTRNVRPRFKTFDSIELRNFPAGAELTVGFAPVAQEQNEIEIRCFERDGRHWYDVCPADLSTRASAVIKDLCDRGSHVIVLPESTMHPEALKAVAKAISEHGPGSQLCFVIAGTTKRENGAGRPYNEAVIFNHRGRELGRQAKLHRWDLDRDLRSKLDLQVSGLDDSRLLFEFIEPGDEITIFDANEFGRFVVMICEDLGRHEPGTWLRHWGMLDWLFTPILDRSISEHRWMDDSGGKAAAEGHCRIVVANSLPLTRRAYAVLNRTGVTSPTSGGVALCINSEAGCAHRFIWDVDLSAGPFTSAVCWRPSAWELWKPRPPPPA
jgi:predicted amidohydrolase